MGVVWTSMDGMKCILGMEGMQVGRRGSGTGCFEMGVFFLMVWLE